MKIEITKQGGCTKIICDVPGKFRVYANDFGDPDDYGISFSGRTDEIHERCISILGTVNNWPRTHAGVIEMIHRANAIASGSTLAGMNRVTRLERQARKATGARQKRLHRKAHKLRRKALQHN